MRQFAVARGINAVEAGGGHRDRHTAGGERAAVCGTVDAKRQPAGDTGSGAGQVTRKRACILASRGRGIAAADHDQLRLRQWRALAEEKKRRQRGSGIGAATGDSRCPPRSRDADCRARSQSSAGGVLLSSGPAAIAASA